VPQWLTPDTTTWLHPLQPFILYPIRVSFVVQQSLGLY
jgi:hypothetical protein